MSHEQRVLWTFERKIFLRVRTASIPKLMKDFRQTQLQSSQVFFNRVPGRSVYDRILCTTCCIVRCSPMKQNHVTGKLREWECMMMIGIWTQILLLAKQALLLTVPSPLTLYSFVLRTYHLQYFRKHWVYLNIKCRLYCCMFSWQILAIPDEHYHGRNNPWVN